MTNLFDKTKIEGISFLENLNKTELNKIRAIANKEIHNAGSLASDLLKDDNSHLYPKDLPIDKRFDYLLGANASYVQSRMVLKLLRFNELLSSIGEYFPTAKLVNVKHYFSKFNPSKKMVLETKTQVSFCFDEYDKFSLLDSESWISELEKYRNKVRQGIKQLSDSENQAGYDAQHGNDNYFLFYTMNAIYKTFPAVEKVLSPIDKTNPLPDQPTSVETSRTLKEINKQFENMDKNGRAYAFISEEDCNTFTDILRRFFEFKEYTLPKTPIQLRRGCKTKLAATLGKIHSELSNVDNFSSDIKYFEIVKCLSHYSKLTNSELYKSLTRSRRDY
jgi:hypothetical protein